MAHDALCFGARADVLLQVHLESSKREPPVGQPPWCAKAASVEANPGGFLGCEHSRSMLWRLSSEDVNELLNPLLEELQKRVGLCFGFLQLEDGSINGELYLRLLVHRP